MAYSTSAPPSLISQRVGADGGAVWVYKTTDSIEDALADDYISDGYDLGLKAGDAVLVIDSDAVSSKLTHVSSVTTDGAATLAGGTQELTVSGAVTPGVQIVELNHTTVLVAATIADFAAHAGIFVVKDTSATGTVAHTLTLTAGTFDGSNNVATLNALGEQLVVLVDGNGDGTILQNTGAVALS